MSVEGSALILAWVMIGLLTLAMAGLLRQVRFLTQALRDRGALASQAVGATGVRPGPVPEELTGIVDVARPTVLVFSTGDCGSCADRLTDLEAIAADEPSLVAIYARNGVSFDSPRIRSLENRYELFGDLGISITPFGIAVRQGHVVDARPLGSTAAVKELLSSVGGSK